MNQQSIFNCWVDVNEHPFSPIFLEGRNQAELGWATGGRAVYSTASSFMQGIMQLNQPSRALENDVPRQVFNHTHPARTNVSSPRALRWSSFGVIDWWKTMSRDSKNHGSGPWPLRRLILLYKRPKGSTSKLVDSSRFIFLSVDPSAGGPLPSG